MYLSRRWQLCLLGLVFCVAHVACVDEESASEPESPQDNTETPTSDNEGAEEAEPVVELPPLKMDEDIACAACEIVVDRIYAHILNVSVATKDEPMKVRKEIAEQIIRGACYRTRGMTLDGKRGSRKFKYPELPTFDEEDKNETDTSDETDSSDEKNVGKDGTAEKVELEEGPHDVLLHKACYYMMSTEGWKLRSRIAGFYKETTSYSLKKRLCHNSLKLCSPPKPAKLKRTEKCLTAAFAAMGKEDWATAMKKADCAQGVPATSGTDEKKSKKKKKSKKDSDASEDNG